MRRATLPTALLLSLLVTVVTPFAARAQAARPAPDAASARRSGVLLGIAGHGTLWIAPDSSGRLRAHGPSGDLIVRRASGFWRVGVVQAMVEEDTAATVSSLVEITGDTIATEAEDPFDPDSIGETVEEIGGDSLAADGCTQGGACEDFGDWFATAVVAAPLDTTELVAVFRAPAPMIEELRATEGHSDFEITFLGDSWISWTQTVEALDPEVVAGFGAALLPFDSLTSVHRGDVPSGVALPIVFPSTDVARQRRECSKQYVRSDSRMVSDADLFSWPDRSWFLQHLSGRWRLTQRFAIGSGAMRGFVFDCVLSDSLPASLVGHDRLTPSWAVIRRQIPAATDAVSSPSGDLVVVATDEWLRVYAPRGGRLGATLLDIPMHFPRIVMAQWTTGDDVAQWTRALSPHLARGR